MQHKFFSFEPVGGEYSVIMWTVPLLSLTTLTFYSDFGRMSQIWLPPFAVSGWFEEQVLWGVVYNLLLWVKSEKRQQRKGMGNSLKAPCPADPRPLLIVVCHAACSFGRGGGSVQPGLIYQRNRDPSNDFSKGPIKVLRLKCDLNRCSQTHGFFLQ